MGVMTNILVSLLTFFFFNSYSCKFLDSLFIRFYQKEHTLAEGFDIKDGSVSIKCPKVDPSKQYIVVCKSP